MDLDVEARRRVMLDATQAFACITNAWPPSRSGWWPFD